MPTLRFTPYAWSKLLYLRDLGDTEVGGFGISAENDLFLIEDFRLIKQRTSAFTVEFDDEAVADFYDEQVDLGRDLERFSRCWIHTHPGDSAEPSSTDEQTFARVFGSVSWSVMFILARGGETYARLGFGCGPGAELLVPMKIAWDVPFPGADPDGWELEYEQCVQEIFQPPKWTSQNYAPEEIVFLEEHPELFDEWDGLPVDDLLFNSERSILFDGNRCDVEPA